MGVLDRVNRAHAARRGRRGATIPSLSLDEWASFFSFGGLDYPIVQTTMGSIDEERIAATAAAAYVSNGPVFALVVARLQAFAQIRFQWTRFSGSQPGDLFGTAELSVLEQPWPGGTTADLLARMEVHNSLAGNAYIRRTRTDRLNMLRPDYVTIVLGSQEDAEHPADAPDVEVAGYLYRPPSNRAHLFFPNEVAHWAPIPDPAFHFLGMSWISPVIRELQADGLATEYKARYFTNAATANLAIKFDPSITRDRVLEFKQLIEEEHTGVANAFRTLYLGGGADPVVIGANLAQVEFAATQAGGESRLAAAAGVPASWVGFSEGMKGSALNAGNFGAARDRFADGTMTHLWTNAAASLQAILRPPDAGTALWFDDRVPFLRQDAGKRAAIQQSEAQTITALIRDGFTPDSAIAAVKNNDWTLLKHTGLTSVQLQPPSDGSEPMPGLAPNITPGPPIAGDGTPNSPTGGGAT